LFCFILIITHGAIPFLIYMRYPPFFRLLGGLSR